MSDWHFTRTRTARVKWYIPGLDYDVLVVHASDLRDDEALLVLSPDVACDMVPEWLEEAFRGDRDLYDLLSELQGLSLSEKSQLAMIQKALRDQELVALKLTARSSMLRRFAAQLEEAERERERKRSEAQNALWRSAPRAPHTEATAPLYHYAIRVVDDTGAPVSGARLKLDIDGTPKMPTTDDSGLATAEWFSKTTAQVRLLNQDELAKRLETRWSTPRSAKLATGPNVHEVEVDAPSDALSVPADIETTLVLCRRQVRRVRLMGMLFDANKSFLLPQALPGVRTIIGLHRERPQDKVLIVGHAGGDEHRAGMDLALRRAEMLNAYLTSQPDAWSKCFDKSNSSYARWGTREMQLMLSALPPGGPPYYEGTASGVSDAKTLRAVKAFQKANGLAVDGKAGPKTLKAVVSAYMQLEDTTLSHDIQPVVHGCEGHFRDTETESGLPPDDRRLEVFFFGKEIVPKPAGATSTAGATDYQAWRTAVLETRDFEHHGIHVQIVDRKKRPVPFADVQLEGPTSGHATADEHGFVSFFGLRQGEYTISGSLQGRPVSKSKLRYPTARTVSEGFSNP